MKPVLIFSFILVLSGCNSNPHFVLRDAPKKSIDEIKVSVKEMREGGSGVFKGNKKP